MAHAPLQQADAFDFTLNAEGQQTIELPEDFSVQSNGFTQAGPDLILTSENGQSLLIENYFIAQPDGIETTNSFFNFQMVESLSGPQAPAQYAQAAPATGLSEPIGQVDTIEGSVNAVRADGNSVTLNIGDPVYQGDVIRTAEGANVGMTFKDESIFSLDENGEIILDEMVYDADSGEGSFSADLTSGVFSFVSGQIAKTNPDGMLLSTPVATIGIRGTQGVLKQEQGGELQAALMEEPGGFVGELVLTNAGGTITLNQPNQYSAVLSFNASPGQPTTLDLAQITSSFGTRSIRTLQATHQRAAQRKADDKRAEAEAEQEAAQQAQTEAEAAEAEAEALAAEAEALAEQAAELEGAEADALLAEAEALAAQAAEAEARALEAAAQAEILAAQAAAAQAQALQAQNQFNLVTQAANNFNAAVSSIEQSITNAINNVITPDTPVSPDTSVADISKNIQQNISQIQQAIQNTIQKEIQKFVQQEKEKIEQNINQQIDEAISNIDKFTTGTSGNDNLAGDELGENTGTLGSTPLRDGIAGLDGDDDIQGGQLTDVIAGGSGNDQIYGGAGDDFIHGDTPSNVSQYQEIYNIVQDDTGSAGNDYIDAGAGNDVIDGGGGADTLKGQAGNDTIEGGAGNDTLYAGTGGDILSGGDGDDILYVYADSITNTYTGDSGTDTLNMNASAYTNIATTDRVFVSFDNSNSGGIQYKDNDFGLIGEDTFTNLEVFDFDDDSYNTVILKSTFLPSAAGPTLSGGSGGDDVLQLQGSSFNFTALDGMTITGFDTLDLSTNNTSISIDDAFKNTGITKIDGDSSDSINFNGEWSVADTPIGTSGYDSYQTTDGTVIEVADTINIAGASI